MRLLQYENKRPTCLANPDCLICNKCAFDYSKERFDTNKLVSWYKKSIEKHKKIKARFKIGIPLNEEIFDRIYQKRCRIILELETGIGMRTKIK